MRIAKGCLRQYGQNNCGILTPATNPGFFMIVTWRESTSLWACLGSHEFLHYLAVRKRALASRPCMEEVIIPPLLVSAGYGHLQHESPEWNGSHKVEYSIHFIPSALYLNVAIALAYVDSMTAGAFTGAG